ncbi:MAG: cytidylyltransferase domain-containing protein [Candidatus Berkiellales bacterium]
MARLGTICARGGSKGVKHKNIRNFCGKPLIAHVIEIAKLSNMFTTLAVSSDSDEILNIAAECGVDYLIDRPFELATDTAAKLPAIQHCVREVQNQSGIHFNTLVDLAATSPLMLPEDIQGAIALLEESDAINVITGAHSDHSPYFSMVEPGENHFVKLVKALDKPYLRRQDCPLCYSMNGAIYVWQAKHFFDLTTVITEQTLIYEMPAERSIDIDTELDFKIAEYSYTAWDGTLRPYREE